jgi:HPt (histidine-containing phosphotransfer) domain-containing protein
MDLPPMHIETAASQAGLAAGRQLLDRAHLRHQTLGDQNLERIVLRLFLDEAPRYAADIETAADATAWRMAIHTLKGVALNIGAFQLAQICRNHERVLLASDPAANRRAAAEIVAMTKATARAISDILAQGSGA